jgi:hypothetical protein
MIKVDDNNNSNIEKIIYQSKIIHHFNSHSLFDYQENKISNNSITQSPKTISNYSIQRFDGRGVPITKGKEKKHHVIFCDQLEIPKTLIHIETIESFKNLNAKNNFDDIYYYKNYSKRRVTCCCTLF